MLRDIIIKIDGTDTVFDSVRDGFVADLRVPLPSIRNRSVEVPGMSGALDYSDVLTGEVEFNSLTVTINLIQRRDTEYDIDAFINAFHGKRVKLYVDGDEKFRRGRLIVKNDNKARELRRISLEMNADPFLVKSVVYDQTPLTDYSPVMSIANQNGQIITASYYNSQGYANGFDFYYYNESSASAQETVDVYADFTVEPNTTYGIQEALSIDSDYTVGTEGNFYELYVSGVQVGEPDGDGIKNAVGNIRNFNSGDNTTMRIKFSLYARWRYMPPRDKAFICRATIYRLNYNIEIENNGYTFAIPTLYTSSGGAYWYYDGVTYRKKNSGEETMYDVMITPGKHTSFMFAGREDATGEIRMEQVYIV